MKGRKKMQLQRLLSYTRKAVDEYSMIQEGDHIAVGISGGKDSLTLLYALQEAFVEMMTTPQDLFHTNTTIGCIVCNARFDKAKLNKIASMARNAYARCINPVGTMADGDSIYACSVGEVESDVNVAGTLAARAMQQAIKRAVTASAVDDREYLKYCLRN